MSGEKYAQRAVKALVDYYTSALPAVLRTIESAQNLAANSLIDPVAYVGANLPGDGRTPLLTAWSSGGSPHEQAEVKVGRLRTYRCSVKIAFAWDADLETGQLVARRYETALVDTLYDDPTLSGAVQQALDTGTTLSAAKNVSTTVHSIEMDVDVAVYET